MYVLIPDASYDHFTYDIQRNLLPDGKMTKEQLVERVQANMKPARSEK